MTISSAPNVAKRVLDRLQRVVVADLAVGLDTWPASSAASGASRRLLRRHAGLVLVRRPVAEPEFERGRDDEHLGVSAARSAHDLVAERAAGDGLVRDARGSASARPEPGASQTAGSRSFGSLFR